MKKLLTCLLLAAALVVNACALEVPINTTIQNLNGSQQLIKTYILPPDADPRQRDPLEFCVNDKLRQYEKQRLSQEWE